ncbi:MAG: hypothetical protein Kow0090_06550 [Myxococcota bacterium]
MLVKLESTVHLDGFVKKARYLRIPATAVTDRIASLRIYSADDLDFLRDFSVEGVELLLPKRPLLDLSLSDIHADLLHDGEGINAPYDGEGVIIGVYDTGIDEEHPAFYRDYKTRILYYWDQDKGDDPPKGFDYGTEYDSEDITEKRVKAIDIIGHGTHVTSITGGFDYEYMGVAPKANFIIVRAYLFEQLVDANKYMVEKAKELGKPIVINMSLGGHGGSHDGATLEEEALDALSGEGAIIVAAAGNEGYDYIHLGYEAKEERQKTYLNLSSGSFSEGGSLLNFWADGDAELDIEFVIEREGSVVASSGVFHIGASLDFPRDDLMGEFGDVNVYAGYGANNNKRNLFFELIPSTNPNTFSDNADGYRWAMSVSGSGGFNAWMTTTDFFGSTPSFSPEEGEGIVPGDNRLSVGTPASASRVIAVGAYVTRTEWTTRKGVRVVDTSSGEVGDIAAFSSRGPSADPARTGLKPEIAAPGSQIIAAFSSDSGEFQENTRIDRNHIVMEGTSMASPHIAGVVALMLQANPRLTPEGVKEIFRLTARRDEFTGEDANEVWGYGKVDAFGAVRSALGLGACSEAVKCAEGYECAGSFCVGDEGAGCIDDLNCGGELLCVEKICAMSAGKGEEEEGEDGGKSGGGEIGAGESDGGGEANSDAEESGCSCRIRISS